MTCQDRYGLPLSTRSDVAATAYRRVDPDEITGSVPKGGNDKCTGSGCNEYVAITCQR